MHAAVLYYIHHRQTTAEENEEAQPHSTHSIVTTLVPQEGKHYSRKPDLTVCLWKTQNC